MLSMTTPATFQDTKWDAHIEELMDFIREYSYMIEGSWVVISPNSHHESLPLLAYNLELSTWTMVQEEFQLELGYWCTYVLTPSLSATP